MWTHDQVPVTNKGATYHNSKGKECTKTQPVGWPFDIRDECSSNVIKMKLFFSAVATVGPIMLDIWGINIPALSLLVGMISVICVRIMFMTKDFRNEATYWYYNISLTILTCVITAAIIADNQLAPGVAVMLGTGIGASGVVLVDILKDKVERTFKALGGNKNEDT